MKDDLKADEREVEALAEEVLGRYYIGEGSGEDYAAKMWPNSCAANGARNVARFILSRESALKSDAERLVAALDDAYKALGETMASGCLHGNGMPREVTQKVNDVHYAAQVRCGNVLREWRASRQPKPSEPTLAEAVEAMLRSAPQIVFGSAPVDHAPLDADGVRLSLVRPAALDAVKVALARERERGGGK